MLHFILDRDGKDSISLSPGRALLRGVARWATFGALGALFSIFLIAITAEQQFPWFYAAWFVTVVVSTGLLGAFGAICSIGRRRLENKRPRPKAA